MALPLNILMLEDNEADVIAIQKVLLKDNPLYLFKLSVPNEVLLDVLEDFKPDLILADSKTREVDVKIALEVVIKQNLNIPFLIVTRSISAKFAVSIIKLGADDYVLKAELARLPKAILDALNQRGIEQEARRGLQCLMKSQKNLKAVFDCASDAIILINGEGIVKEFNGKARDILLLITERIIVEDENVFNFIEDLGESDFKITVMKLESGETIQYDKSHHTKVGKLVWINYSFISVNNGDAFSRVCITIRDITKRKAAEYQKEFDQNNLYALINNTKDLMWSVDRDFRLITSNHAFDDMVLIVTGLKPEKGTYLLKDSFDNERVSRAKARYERAFSGETFTDLEYIADPFEIWLEQSFYPIYEGAAVIGTACFSRDITARKKSEAEINAYTERVFSIINALPANIALLDEMGRIIEVNDSWNVFARLNGYEGPEGNRNGDFWAKSGKAIRMNATDEIAVATGIRDVLKNIIKQFVFEYTSDGPDGKKWFRLITTQLSVKGNNGAVVMHIDVSEIRRLEQERIKRTLKDQKLITQAVLKAEDKERTRLGLELHDNITQLLAVIKMRLGFYLAHLNKGVSIIEECIGYVQEALSETRDLSHKMVLPRFEEYGFNLSVNVLVEKYQRLDRKVRLEMREMDSVHISAGIKETLYRIVQEQLNNIEKYAYASSVVIEMIAFPDRVTVILRDNGIGFDLTKKGGGIGFSNIVNRVESYDGWANIISEPGKGCTLIAEIPIS